MGIYRIFKYPQTMSGMKKPLKSCGIPLEIQFMTLKSKFDSSLVDTNCITITSFLIAIILINIETLKNLL